MGVEILPPQPLAADPPEAAPGMGACVDAAEAVCMHVPAIVETDIKEGDNGWGVFTRHIESLCQFMERCIWPVDPDADIMPKTLLPFEYNTPDGKESEEVLKCLLGMLTVGLQGHAFSWKYKFEFDVVFSDERKAYLVLLNSVRRMWNRGLSEKPSETPAEAGAGAGAAGGAAQSADFSAPASSKAE
jgi:hypothetical protein